MARYYRTSIDSKQLYRITTQILDGMTFTEIAKNYSHSPAWVSEIFNQVWHQYKTPQLIKSLEIYKTYKKNTVMVDFLREPENKKEFLRELERHLLKKTG